MSIVYLIGFMGAGKSTVGHILAERLGMPFVDMDQAIESRTGRTVSQIFADSGEEEFRRLESDILKELSGQPPAVIACGGGVVIRDENRVLLKRTGRVVYLQVSAEEALARIGDIATRPILTGAAGVVTATSILAARKALYSAVADITIDTGGLTVDAVATLVAEHLEEV